MALDEQGRFGGIVKILDPNVKLNLRFKEPRKGNIEFDARYRLITRIEAVWHVLKPKLMIGIRNHKKLFFYIKLVYSLLKTEGIGGLKRKFREMYEREYRQNEYGHWIVEHDTIGDGDRTAIRKRIDQMVSKPLISVIMPVFNVPLQWLEQAIESVKGQCYPNWELCIADDCSSNPELRPYLLQQARLDARIKVVFRERNGHISEASNSALELATGQFIALMDHDDLLSEHALYMLVEELNAYPSAEIIYSDEDKVDVHGNRQSPYFKPDWDPDLFLGQNMMTHLIAYRVDLVRKLGGFRKGYEGSQDYDLALRAIEMVEPSSIRHIPFVLYHWRMLPGSVALAAEEKNYAHSAAKRAISDHLIRTGQRAAVQSSTMLFHRVTYRLPERAPLVSIIIPTRDRTDLLAPMVDDLLTKTDYDLIEVLILDNGSTETKTIEYFAKISENPKVKIIKYDKPFNYSAINNFGVANAKGSVIALLNNDLRVLTPDWLKEMVSNAVRPGIGVVGARLLYPDMTIQHAGVVLGIGGVAGHIAKKCARTAQQMGRHPQLSRTFSVVTGACMVMRRDVFESCGGLDERLAVAFNDVDFCLRVREKGLRNIWLAHAELLHLESATRGSEDTPQKLKVFHKARIFMCERWGDELNNDPYYNPNLTLTSESMALAFSPRVKRPWRETNQA